MEAVLAMLIAIFGITLSTEKTEILLLDSNKTSAITVKSKDTNSILNTPNSYLELSNIEAFSGMKKILNEDEVNAKYGDMIRSSIEPAKSYLLYFTDGNTLTQESLEKIDLIKKTIKDRKPCSISIIGHTDTLGSDKLNEILSLNRAKIVSKIFQNEEVIDMEVLSFGEKNLLIKTPDNIFEPKNRRVEVQIR